MAAVSKTCIYDTSAYPASILRTKTVEKTAESTFLIVANLNQREYINWKEFLNYMETGYSLKQH